MDDAKPVEEVAAADDEKKSNKSKGSKKSGDNAKADDLPADKGEMWTTMPNNFWSLLTIRIHVSGDRYHVYEYTSYKFQILYSGPPRYYLRT